MSSPEIVLEHLLGPSLTIGHKRAPVLDLYTRRLFALEREVIYSYLHARRTDILPALGNPQRRGRFVLSALAVAPPDHWGEWFPLLPKRLGYSDPGGLGSQVLRRVLALSGALDVDAIRYTVRLIPALAPALGELDGEEVKAIAAAAREMLERRAWWTEEPELEIQAALHALVEGVEAAAPALAEPLATLRVEDLSRAPLDVVLSLRGIRELAHRLPDEAIANLQAELPKFSPEENPDLFAERAATNVSLATRRSPRAIGRAVASQYMPAIRKLNALRTHRSLKLVAIGECIQLQPSSAQLTELSRYAGPNPGEVVLGALPEWSERSDRHKRADLLERLIRPTFNASRWVAAITAQPYVEAPVIRKLGTEMRKGRNTAVGQRRSMAAIVGGLNLRTKDARNKAADLIASLLKKERPKSDLGVALIIADGLGHEHHRQVKIERALIAYSKRHDYQFRPDEYRSIVKLGVALPEKYLSKNSRKSSRGIVEAAVKDGVKQLASLLSPS